MQSTDRHILSAGNPPSSQETPADQEYKVSGENTPSSPEHAEQGADKLNTGVKNMLEDSYFDDLDIDVSLTGGIGAAPATPAAPAAPNKAQQAAKTTAHILPGSVAPAQQADLSGMAPAQQPLQQADLSGMAPAQQALQQPALSGMAPAQQPLQQADLSGMAPVQQPALSGTALVPQFAAENLPQASEYSARENTGDAIIPRISIEIFFERPAVQSIVSIATADRRMSNTTIDMISGGLPAAIQHYARNSNPNLIVVESVLPGPQMIAQLDALAAHCDENVKVVVIGTNNDVELYRELVRRGVSEYLVPPFQPIQFIRAISTLFTDPDAKFSGRTIAVCGAKGGVGASTIAHNLAWASAECSQLGTTLVDLDLNFGTAGLDFNQDRIQSIADILSSPDRIDAALLARIAIKISSRLSLLNAPASMDIAYEFAPEAYGKIIEEVRKTVPAVFLDVPHIWNETTRATLMTADEVIIVAAPELASLRNAKNMIDYLLTKRQNDLPPNLVMNMVNIPGRPEISVKEFVGALGIGAAATINFDPRLFGMAANSGRMIKAVSANAKSARIIENLAFTLTGRDASRKKGLEKLIERAKALLNRK